MNHSDLFSGIHHFKSELVRHRTLDGLTIELWSTYGKAVQSHKKRFVSPILR